MQHQVLFKLPAVEVVSMSPRMTNVAYDIDLFTSKQKRRSKIAADTTRKGVTNDIDDSVLSVRHRHTGFAFHGFPQETQYRMAGAGACGRCLSGCNLPLIFDFISRPDFGCTDRNPPSRDGFFACHAMNQPASFWFAASTATPRVIGALRRPSASSSALRHSLTLRALLACPIKPMRHTLPAIAPSPAPISRS